MSQSYAANGGKNIRNKKPDTEQKKPMLHKQFVHSKYIYIYIDWLVGVQTVIMKRGLILFNSFVSPHLRVRFPDRGGDHVRHRRPLHRLHPAGWGCGCGHERRARPRGLLGGGGEMSGLYPRITFVFFLWETKNKTDLALITQHFKPHCSTARRIAS